MKTELAKTVIEHFSNLKDPRIDRKKLYPLMEILLIVLSGAICGADSWRDFVIFGKEKKEFFKQYFPYKNGIPSKNTFARVFAALCPASFKTCFIEWVQSLQEILHDVIAIDGKTLRRSFDKGSKQAAIHMVSAFATQAKLVLGQQKVAEKSNEITAIPLLLEVLYLKGSIVTIDAMGCQKNIAEKIISKEADYILALKGNHETLHEDVKLFFKAESEKEKSNFITDKYHEVDAGHGRIETRECWISDKLDWLEQKEEWKDLKTVAMIEETREIGEKKSVERRFFISSLEANAQVIASAVRSHWGIENTLHWVLDMTFREDESRIRGKNAAENMAIVRHIALNMLQNAKKTMKDISIKGLRKAAGWGNSTLELILKQHF
jgi:predicted transposase YbfD/YdcC